MPRGLTESNILRTGAQKIAENQCSRPTHLLAVSQSASSVSRYLRLGSPICHVRARIRTSVMRTTIPIKHCRSYTWLIYAETLLSTISNVRPYCIRATAHSIQVLQNAQWQTYRWAWHQVMRSGLSYVLRSKNRCRNQTWCGKKSGEVGLIRSCSVSQYANINN